MSHPYLSAVIDLVREAGDVILPYWRSELAVEEKADASPVTAADLAAHHLLSDKLSALDGSIPVLSEEACDLPLEQRARWTRWWLVDPLDGTKEFIAGSEEFTVNVALIEEGRVVFGVVGIPATGRCYYGGSDIGAWASESSGEAKPLRVRSENSGTLRVVASRRHSSAAQERLIAGLKQTFDALELVNIGSSLKLCLLAEGEADCYPRLAPTSQWDTAAAQGVLEGAGGEVLDVTGVPLDYAARADFLNPSFLALPQGVSWRDRLIELANRG
ncbi:3'(2'),5'-bisphosphate nucleotidase CysQ [Stutzerimonas azotifigens]|uniref:3'(2'),5'-bisphosphate nucleotidase CysQ n=1 Tax=Stutzerimonas azotifigens TaxID=291995 RepID=A0ABR5Z0W7_9GAMM|nr:3'(2'),5'-bisphosphate nucleotidase CysQ [Stutzerimonas azotifigens]MBA1273805.1 3'(2'),5'-bisphosphate nucleotidase CysQ [Stutzerimonas azotifigens]